MAFELLPGRRVPLGATFDGDGVNFAVFSECAVGVDLCLFDEQGHERRLPFVERSANVWHGYVPGLKPGQRYGFRVHGPYDPKNGQRFNPNKLLVDPYARTIEGHVDYREPVFGYAGSPFPGFAGTRERPRDAVMDTRDSASGVPRSVVVDDRFDWEGDAPPHVPWADTILYETHVRSMTAQHPGVPPELRGTFLGLASDPVLEHLKKLGITSVELLPIHEHVDEWSIVARGLPNYWGYSTLGFFAPDQRFATKAGAQVREFKQMVKRLHRAGIEVVLDVVYNHTCEGDELGPTLCLRGLDNATYYRLHEDDRARYEDYTGCGNSLNMLHPQTLKLIMDSLRYWVTEMHVDGFRFDLASTLARETSTVDKMSAFFDIIHQDPILSNVKLIAEPWDLGQGGYQVGNFPILWAEWNGRYRDTVRRFWMGRKETLGDMGYRLTGSSDLYEDDGRHPHASINFVTAHDGFSLRDLVSYEKKRNEANGEENRDGTDDNASWNGGVEGASNDPAVNALRERQQKNFLATLLLSQGVPMLLSGDELGKTQQGNNNAYAQDNAISWLDWQLDDTRRAFLVFVRGLVAFRKRHPVFRRHHFLTGERVGDSALPDVAWFHPDGREMREQDWQTPRAPVVAWLLGGDAIASRDAKGKPLTDDSFLVIMNGSRENVTFRLPDRAWGARWTLCIDTREAAIEHEALFDAGTPLPLAPNVVMVFRRT